MRLRLTKQYCILLVNNSKIIAKWAGKFVSLFCCALLLSCSSDPVVASVDDSELHESDAEVLMTHLGFDVSKKEDWKSFVNYWIDRQVFLEELKKSNPEKHELVLLRAQSFSGELARFYIEEEFIAGKMNQTVSDSSINEYYTNHKQEFGLNDYIVKALYIKTPKNAPKQSEIAENYLLKKDKDFTKVISYAKLYAENFYFDDSSWIYFDELTKDAPIEQLNKDNLVLNRTKTHFSDDEYSYYLNIIDYKVKDAIPPKEFIQDQIKQIILSQRLNEIKEKQEATFIKKIKSKHEINIHI